MLGRVMIFLDDIVSETTVHLGLWGGPELLTIRPGPKLLTGLPGPELLTVRPAGAEPLTDCPGPLTDCLGGTEPLTGRRSCGLCTGRPGPPELTSDFPEPPEPLMGRPELHVLLTVLPGGFESLTGLLVPLTDLSDPELELPFWRLSIELGLTFTMLGRPGAGLELLPGCLTPGLLVLCGVTAGPGLEWLGWGGDFLALCSVTGFCVPLAEVFGTLGERVLEWIFPAPLKTGLSWSSRSERWEQLLGPTLVFSPGMDLDENKPKCFSLAALLGLDFFSA